MALGDPYAEVPTLKARFNIPDGDDDDALEQALLAASRSVDQFCHRQFNDAGEASERTFTPLTSGVLLVDDFHERESLAVGELTADDVDLEPANGVVDGDPGWPFWRIIPRTTRFPARTHVTARWGWAEVPAPVVDVTLQVAAELFKLKDAPFGVAGFGEFGAVRVRKNPNFVEMLAPYRRHGAVVA